MLIVTLCIAVALLGAADCHVIPEPQTSERLLPPLVAEKTGREEEMVAVEGVLPFHDDDGQMEREMETVIADMVEGGEVVDGGRALVEEEKEMVDEEDWETAEEMMRGLDGWVVPLNGQRSFKIMWSSRTWAEAERYCLIYGANLASVHSAEEYQFLQSTLTTSYAWIGGYDATQEHVWFWSDGSKMDYLHWAHGEPDNDRGQHCMVMNHGGMLRWADGWCSEHNPFICAKPAV